MKGATPWLGTVAPTNRMTSASADASSTGLRRSKRRRQASRGRGGSNWAPMTPAARAIGVNDQSVGDPGEKSCCRNVHASPIDCERKKIQATTTKLKVMLQRAHFGTRSQ